MRMTSKMIPPVIPMVPALAAAPAAVTPRLAAVTPTTAPAALARASRITARPVADSQPKNAEPHLIPPERGPLPLLDHTRGRSNDLLPGGITAYRRATVSRLSGLAARAQPGGTGIIVRALITRGPGHGHSWARRVGREVSLRPARAVVD